MFETIRWRCFLRVRDRRAAERVVGRVERVMGREVRMERYERYWKIPELAEVWLVSPLHRTTAESALLTTLRSAWQVATPWSLAPPGPGPGEEFEGSAILDAGARFAVPGVEWMQFFLSEGGSRTAEGDEGG
ncbi:hypothetical protein [Streptomyces sp. NPDC050560]|uniref:hypothetical protein n=1 Tax=Streptomyces sp. NPDC050560 TaxID=3365630 RepID=UPI00379F7A5C